MRWWRDWLRDTCPYQGRCEGLCRCQERREGATLGGRVIARQLARTLSIGPDTGAAFFAGYGERAGAMWMAYRASFARYVAAGYDADAVTAAAVDTFATLERWLHETGVARTPTA
jgi:heme oxygenase